jgi:hypothetical protein
VLDEAGTVETLEVKLFPLVPDAALPTPAPAATREHVPPGYGVQEQCLPFTAAAALGFLIGSPITFGLCPPAEVPPASHAFRSPLEDARRDALEDGRVFYVRDDPRCRFVGNAFMLDEVPLRVPGGSGRFRPVEPGLSFFDRDDQRGLFKVHLPYIWRTPPGIDCLFLPTLNRAGLIVLAGLVETDWYASPVNLVVHRPPLGHSVHVETGDPIAQAIFIERSHRRPALHVLASHARAARDLRAQLADWYRQHARDRSAYKKLARSHHGRTPAGSPPPSS